MQTPEEQRHIGSPGGTVTDACELNSIFNACVKVNSLMSRT